MLDMTLLISTRKNIRLTRALKRKNLPLEQIQNRMSLQMKETKKKEKADYIIENNASKENFNKKLINFYNALPI